MKVSLLHDEVRSRPVEHLSHVLHVRIEIIRVGDGLKGRRQQLLGGISHDSAQGAVNSHPPAVRSYQRHADSCELERATEPRLALAQGGCPTSLGVAMSLHDKCRQGGRELNEISLPRRRRSSLAV